MGTFNTKAVLNGNSSLIPAIAERICQDFAADGFDVKREDLISGGADISIAKGNMFKAALGMKTALKITLIPVNNGISFEAGVGIFGQQVIPTIIMWFFFWPVLLTQIWGLVKQAQLDDKALAIAQSVVNQNGGYSYYNVGNTTPPSPPVSGGAFKFCTNCGNKVADTARFCPNCGNQLN